MTDRRVLIDRLALSILDGKGIGAIWQLHLDAAHAYATGYPAAAEAILELAGSGRARADAARRRARQD